MSESRYVQISDQIIIHPAPGIEDTARFPGAFHTTLQIRQIGLDFIFHLAVEIMAHDDVAGLVYLSVDMPDIPVTRVSRQRFAAFRGRHMGIAVQETDRVITIIRDSVPSVGISGPIAAPAGQDLLQFIGIIGSQDGLSRNLRDLFQKSGMLRCQMKIPHIFRDFLHTVIDLVVCGQDHLHGQRNPAQQAVIQILAGPDRIDQILP